MNTALAHFASFCGPVALGSALGATPETVAETLFRLGWLYADGSTDLDRIDAVLGVARRDQPAWYPDRPGAVARPTVTAWVREHPVGSYVLYVSGHVLHVADGWVAADSAPGGSGRARVIYFWPVRWGPAEGDCPVIPRD